jgi:hypothetical protein
MRWGFRLLQLVGDKCLAVVAQAGQSHIYMESNVKISGVISSLNGKVFLNHDRLGDKRIFAYDETNRLLGVLYGEKVGVSMPQYLYDCN